MRNVNEGRIQNRDVEGHPRKMATEHANSKSNSGSQKQRRRRRQPQPPRSALSHLLQPARSAQSSTRVCRAALAPRPELLPWTRPFSGPEGSIPSIETDPGLTYRHSGCSNTTAGGWPRTQTVDLSLGCEWRSSCSVGTSRSIDRTSFEHAETALCGFLCEI